MSTLTIENYVKAIYQICTAGEGRPAATGKVAEALGVLPGTATAMIKTLNEAGLASYTPYEGVCLTEAGTILAVRVVRRHRLVELFLVKTLALKWDEVHEEAEHLEHAVSDWLVDRIDEYLRFPEFDPHGDPIPRADGSMRASSAVRLSELADAARFRIVRVLDQTPEFLRFLSESRLTIGSEGTVLANRAATGVIRFRCDDQESMLSQQIAAKLAVETLGEK